MRYEIVSEAYPVVVCYLEGGEQMRTERGSMVWMVKGAMNLVFGGEGVFNTVLTGPGTV